jgi:hypothetical protein
MLLNIFTDFDITTDWKWILLAVGIVVAIIFLIIMLKRHLKTMIFLVFLIGFAFLFYWANSKFAFSFSESMACKEIVRKFDKEEYNRIEIDDVFFYYRKTTDENNNPLSTSSDCFAVKKFWFTYFERNPKISGNKTIADDSGTYIVSYKYYIASDNTYILQIDAKKAVSSPEVAYVIPSFTAYSGNQPINLEQKGQYTYVSSSRPEKLVFADGTEIETKETK